MDSEKILTENLNIIKLANKKNLNVKNQYPSQIKLIYSKKKNKSCLQKKKNNTIEAQ